MPCDFKKIENHCLKESRLQHGKKEASQNKIQPALKLQATQFVSSSEQMSTYKKVSLWKHVLSEGKSIITARHRWAKKIEYIKKPKGLPELRMSLPASPGQSTRYCIRPTATSLEATERWRNAEKKLKSKSVFTDGRTEGLPMCG